MNHWNEYVAEEREAQLVEIINTEKLREEATRRYIEYAFRLGEIKTIGTDLDKIMPPVSRFGGGDRAAKKRRIIERLKVFFNRFYGIGGAYASLDYEDETAK